VHVAQLEMACSPPRRPCAPPLFGRRDGDERISQLDDAELVDRMHDEVVEALRMRAAPVESVVTRWTDAFPQYDVGHLGRIDAAERALARELPGVRLVGASYRGVGIASCVRQAREAAQHIRTA